VHLYVKMLRSCSAGIRAVELSPPDGAYVVAGATAPYGSPVSPSHPTPPLRFATEMKKIAAWMDEGIFSRSVLDAFPPPHDLRAALEHRLTPVLLRQVDAVTEACGR
jgi:hypothetical protein